MSADPVIALALSGGGSRAIAFHLGCMRALHDRALLERVSVLSAVSGGSVIAAMWAYQQEPFSVFERRVISVLREGLQREMVRQLLRPKLAAKVLATNLIARPTAWAARLLKRTPPLPRWASRTDALEEVLASYLGKGSIKQVARPGLDVIINACELRTGSAFRFGNKRSGSWRFGEVVGNEIELAHAVAASAAYPMLLPAFDRTYRFQDRKEQRDKRVIITDGGIFDNLGTSCLEPGRSNHHSLHVYNPDYLICCSAGFGQFSGENIPFGMLSRFSSSFEAVFRKAQDVTVGKLHLLRESGKLKGFILAYLGQQDNALPTIPSDLVTRDACLGYPTNFSAMPQADIEQLSLRGEQLTHLLVSAYIPEL